MVKVPAREFNRVTEDARLYYQHLIVIRTRECTRRPVVDFQVKGFSAWQARLYCSSAVVLIHELLTAENAIDDLEHRQQIAGLPDPSLDLIHAALEQISDAQASGEYETWLQQHFPDDQYTGFIGSLVIMAFSLMLAASEVEDAPQSMPLPTVFDDLLAEVDSPAQVLDFLPNAVRLVVEPLTGSENLRRLLWELCRETAQLMSEKESDDQGISPCGSEESQSVMPCGDDNVVSFDSWNCYPRLDSFLDFELLERALRDAEHSPARLRVIAATPESVSTWFVPLLSRDDAGLHDTGEVQTASIKNM
ncbi:MAG: hypothetical protein SOS98_02105 [Varibaculum sp.]|nr:hypothetical protein [Varibaculum sp.]